MMLESVKNQRTRLLDKSSSLFDEESFVTKKQYTLENISKYENLRELSIKIGPNTIEKYEGDITYAFMKLKNLRILNLEFLNFISYTDKISFSESLIHLPYLISFKTAFSCCAKIFKETSIYIVLGSLGKVLPKCNQI
jgi:hypothetical protein